VLTHDLAQITPAQHPPCTAAEQQIYSSQTFVGFSFCFVLQPQVAPGWVATTWGEAPFLGGIPENCLLHRRL